MMATAATKKSKANRKRSWKMERASVRQTGKRRARSNKFSKSDSGKKPKTHQRKGFWVGGYRRKNGVKVKGYYRTSHHYQWKLRR
jgi:hypothetical protein